MVTVGVESQPYRVDSALGVSAIMRYINRRFTYLLTGQIVQCERHVGCGDADVAGGEAL